MFRSVHPCALFSWRIDPFPFQHDCDNNVELFREGRYITFRVIKMIGVGEEVTAHYGDGYCEFRRI